MVQEAPLSSLSLGSITGPTANCVKLPPTEHPTANTCEGAEGPRQLRLLQEIENLSMGELKDKIREVWPRHPSRSTAHSDDPLRLTLPLPSLIAGYDEAAPASAPTTPHSASVIYAPDDLTRGRLTCLVT